MAKMKVFTNLVQAEVERDAILATDQEAMVIETTRRPVLIPTAGPRRFEPSNGPIWFIVVSHFTRIVP